jgi:orotate phosphoribosyltransferase
VSSELAARLVERALLEGDFVLRSGKRSARLSEAVCEHEPDVVRLACPVLGAVVLAASASLTSGLPFIIVRDEAKEYGTARRIEGFFEQGELVCLLEDVVTTGGALVEAVSALREEGLVVRTAVCVVDREEGGSDTLARLGVRLRPLFRAEELLEVRKTAANRDG